MLLASVVLYIDSPVGYNVFKEQGRLMLKPAIDTNADSAPEIAMVREGASWSIDGTADPAVHEQLFKIVQMTEVMAVLSEQSVAS